MQYIIFIIIFCFFIFLFSLYIFCNDDFVLFRKNLTTEKIFNIAFLLGFSGLLTSRIIYVLFHFAPGFINPLVFFLFPYFPGLSFIGGIVGAVIYFTIYAQMQKLPYGRMVDFFSLSFSYTLPFGFVLYCIIAGKHLSILNALLFVFLLISPSIYKYLFQKNILKDGSIGIAILFFTSIFSLAASFIEKREKVFLFLAGEDIIVIIFCLILICIFVKQEEILPKFNFPFKWGSK